MMKFSNLILLTAAFVIGIALADAWLSEYAEHVDQVLAARPLP